ncbi:predicted protein [Micromonas commoda]|uniref:Uncharacterized protein n=1 Tax=Micromonas commoda (strain RCC299 / NOUM17 / CCMP2709) TaxID=296587 RepID=C1E9V3_MICCC|nr:predicted protein [Micromonas commoda]ACO64745.1 predicted protein [Micromonas commoda]|eukprot:XP_002503487.1 predicted protein [Micromonas commoda]
MTHPVKDAASGLLRLTGTVLRGAGKITAGVVDAALVCSAVGALRRSKMRGVVKAAVKSAQKAVGEMIENIMRAKSDGKDCDSLGEVLVKCFIVIPVMTPVFVVVGNMAFVCELGAGTMAVAGPPGLVAFAGMRYLRSKDSPLGRREVNKLDKLMTLARLVGIAAPCAVLFDGKGMNRLFDEVAAEIDEEEREEARRAREEEARERESEEERGESGARGEGAEAAV